MSQGDSLIRLCNVAEVDPDIPARAELDGVAYAIFQVDGQCYVTQDLCTHGPGNLSDGHVDGREVECPFHQGRFDITTGRPTGAPCIQALRVWVPEIRDGGVMIDPAQGRVHDE